MSDTAKKVLEMRAKGVSAAEIAKKLQVTTGYVYSIKDPALKARTQSGVTSLNTADSDAQMSTIAALIGIQSLTSNQRLEMIRKIVK